MAGVPLDHVLAFALAVALLMMIPGPNMALIVANSLTHGVRWGLITVMSTAGASMVQLALVAAGLASVVAGMGTWFEWLRWAGVVYLVVLGIRQWRARPPALAGAVRGSLSVGRVAARAAMVSVTNPKTLLFYAAFFPQFIVIGRPAVPQLVLLAALYLGVSLTLDSLWAVLAARLRPILGQGSRIANRASGTVLIGAGIGLALERSR